MTLDMNDLRSRFERAASAAGATDSGDAVFDDWRPGRAAPALPHAHAHRRPSGVARLVLERREASEGRGRPWFTMPSTTLAPVTTSPRARYSRATDSKLGIPGASRAYHRAHRCDRSPRCRRKRLGARRRSRSGFWDPRPATPTDSRSRSAANTPMSANLVPGWPASRPASGDRIYSVHKIR
jgi:hypothetical protein